MSKGAAHAQTTYNTRRRDAPLHDICFRSYTDAPRYIGMASMLPDKTIVLNLTHEVHGILFHDELRYRPGDVNYEEVLAHLGGMSPGDWKLVTPFVDGR